MILNVHFFCSKCWNLYNLYILDYFGTSIPFLIFMSFCLLWSTPMSNTLTGSLSRQGANSGSWMAASGRKKFANRCCGCWPVPNNRCLMGRGCIYPLPHGGVQKPSKTLQANHGAMVYLPTFAGVIFWVNVGKYSSTMEDMGNRDASKSSILMGFSLINHLFWGTPIYGKPHMEVSMGLLRY